MAVILLAMLKIFNYCAWMLKIRVCISVNQHLLPPTFPKAAGFPSWFKMHEYFATVMSSFREACVLFANSSTNRCSLSTIINFLSSVATGPKTNLLERSLVQCVVFYNPNVNKLGLGLGEAEQKLTLLGIPIDAFMSKVSWKTTLFGKYVYWL